MTDPTLHSAVSVRRVDGAPPRLDAFERLRGGGCGWLLDSALGDSPLSRVSLLGAAPWAVARVRGARLDVEVLRAADPRWPVGRHVVPGGPIEGLRRLLPPPPPGPAPGLPFVGGAVGALGYELAEQLDVHRLHGRDDLGLPDAVLLLVDRVLAWDHAEGRVLAAGLGVGDSPGAARDRARDARCALTDALARPPAPAPPPAARSGAPEERIDPAAYAKAVDAVKQEIAAGNVYQACLTARASRPYGGDPWQLHRALRRLNPAPFACFLELPEVAVVGSSPERFLRVDRDGGVESRPIKGTAPRGRDPLEDAARREALRRSQKDRAENLMIVDLVRNDLGRVCRIGSVHVPELMAIEAYASVFQMVSTVRGRLAEGRDA
ncbi:MAG: anthranilate synthase component I family protein, partial [Myxococcota bacterium]